MKLKILLFVIIISSFSLCNKNSIKEKVNVFDGTYKVTETGSISRIGVWVFSKDEITILLSNTMENSYADLGLIAVQKYYIKDNFIYTCLCSSNDCLNKENSFEKIWEIKSVNQTNNKRTIILTKVFDTSFKIKLEKNKSIGLDVKDWE